MSAGGSRQAPTPPEEQRGGGRVPPKGQAPTEAALEQLRDLAHREIEPGPGIRPWTRPAQPLIDYIAALEYLLAAQKDVVVAAREYRDQLIEYAPRMSPMKLPPPDLTKARRRLDEALAAVVSGTPEED